MAEIYICTICTGVPSEPVITELCDHICCASCLTEWQKNASACPLCRHPLELDDVEQLKGAHSKMYELLKIKCIHAYITDSPTYSVYRLKI